MESLRLPVIFVTLVLMTQCVFAKDRCVWGQGKVVCRKDPTKAARVALTLMDWDGGTFFDPDDKMGFDITNDDGTFKIEGCGGDFGPWNDADPYLRVFHFCNSEKGETLETKVMPIFAPETLDFGELVLDK